MMVRPWQRWLNHPAVLTLLLLLAGWFIAWQGGLLTSAEWSPTALRAAMIGVISGGLVVLLTYIIWRPEQAARWLAGLQEMPTSTRWLAAGVFIAIMLPGRALADHRAGFMLGALVGALAGLPLSVRIWDRAEGLRRKANGRKGA